MTPVFEFEGAEFYMSLVEYGFILENEDGCFRFSFVNGFDLNMI